MGRERTKLIRIYQPFGSAVTDIHPTLIPENSILNPQNVLYKNGSITHGKGNTALNPAVTIKTGGVVLKSGLPIIIVIKNDDNVIKYENGVWTAFTGTASGTDATNQHLDIVEGFLHIYNVPTAFGVCNSPIYRYDLNANTVSALVTNPVQGDFTFNKAKTIGIYSNFIFIGNLNETPSGGSATDYPQRLRWSQYNVPNNWKNNPDGTGQSGYFDFDENTEILGLSRYANFLVIFTNQGIYFLEYVGGDTIHEVIQVIREDESGTLLSPQSFIIIEDNIFFATQRDIYLLRGKMLQPILKGLMKNDYLKDISLSTAKFSTMTYDGDNNIVKLNIPKNDGVKVYNIDLTHNAIYTDVYIIADVLTMRNYISSTTTQRFSDEILFTNNNVYRFSDNYQSRFNTTQNMIFETKIFGMPETNQIKRIKGIELFGTAQGSGYIMIEYLPSQDGMTFTSGIAITQNIYAGNFVIRGSINKLTKYYKIRVSFNPVLYSSSRPLINGIKIYEEPLSMLSV